MKIAIRFAFAFFFVYLPLDAHADCLLQCEPTVLTEEYVRAGRAEKTLALPGVLPPEAIVDAAEALQLARMEVKSRNFSHAEAHFKAGLNAVDSNTPPKVKRALSKEYAKLLRMIARISVANHSSHCRLIPCN